MHVAAVGGVAPSDAVRTLEYDLHIKDAKLPELDAIYRVTKEGKMRIDILASGARVYTEGFDGSKGWDMDDKGIAKDDPAGAALWHGTQFPGQILGLPDSLRVDTA